MPVVSDRRAGEPESFVGAIVQGVRLGIKWMTIVLGPVMVLILLSAVGTTVKRFTVVGSAIITDPDLRWETLKMLGSPFGGYAICCFWGIVAGLLVCPLAYLTRRAKKRARTDGDS